MRTVAQVVQDVMQNSPFLQEVLGEGLANISSLARRIQPAVEKVLLQPVSEEAISMALRRMPSPSMTMPQQFLSHLNNITVRSQLVEFVIPHYGNVLEMHHRILKTVQGFEDVFLHISHGLYESVVVINDEYRDKVREVLVQPMQVRELHDISSVTIRFPAETIETPGVYAPIFKALSWRGINVIEVISIGSELSMLFRSEDVHRAFAVIKGLR